VETGTAGCVEALSAAVSAEEAGISEAGEMDSTGCTGVAWVCWKKKQNSTSTARTASPPPSTMRQRERGLRAADAGAAELPAGVCSSRILRATSSGLPSSAMARASFSDPAASR